MTTAHLVVTILGAAMAAFSAVCVFCHASWVVGPLGEYGVPRSWWPWLGVAKAAGAAGLLAGLAVPVLGVLAGIGLVLYFLGATVTVARARRYSHIPAPLMYLAPVAASLALGFAG